MGFKIFFRVPAMLAHTPSRGLRLCLRIRLRRNAECKRVLIFGHVRQHALSFHSLLPRNCIHSAAKKQQKMRIFQPCSKKNSRKCNFQPTKTAMIAGSKGLSPLAGFGAAPQKNFAYTVGQRPGVGVKRWRLSSQIHAGFQKDHKRLQCLQVNRYA